MASAVAHDNSPATLARSSGRRLRTLWRRRTAARARPAIVWMLILAMLPAAGCKTAKPPEACNDPWVKSVPHQALDLPNPRSCDPVDGRAIETARPHSLRNSDPVEYWPLTLEEAIRMGLEQQPHPARLGGPGADQSAIGAKHLRSFDSRNRPPPGSDRRRIGLRRDSSTREPTGSPAINSSTTFSSAAAPTRSPATRPSFTTASASARRPADRSG